MEAETEVKVSHLFMCTYMSDVTFTFPVRQPGQYGMSSSNHHACEERGVCRRDVVEFPAHRFVLCRQSVVFQAMFYGPLANCADTITIEDIEPEIMRELLRFVYCNKARLNGDNVFRCVNAAVKYDITGLTEECVTFLRDNIGTDNACCMHKQAVFFDLSALQKECLNFMLEHATEILKTDGFLELPYETLLELLRSDKMIAEEVDIFTACISWSEYKCKMAALEISPQNIRSNLEDALYQIRFPTMSKSDFFDTVMSTHVLSSEEESEISECLDIPSVFPVDKFIHRERTGRHILLHIKYDKNLYRTGSTYGCNLFIRRVQESYHHGNSDDSLRLKEITGSFVPSIRRVFSIQCDNQKTEIEDYKIDYSSKTIIFLKPIETIDTTHVTFQTSDEYTLRNSLGALVSFPTGRMIMTDKFYEDGLKVHVKGIPCVVTQIPKGLISLTFLK